MDVLNRMLSPLLSLLSPAKIDDIISLLSSKRRHKTKRLITGGQTG